MMGNRFIRAMIVACAMAMTAAVAPVQAQLRAQADLLDFRSDMLAAFQSAQPDLNFRRDPSDPARILSDTITVDVTNAFNETLAFPEETRESIIAYFVDASLRISPQFMDDLHPKELVTVLRSAGYIDHLSQIGTPFLSRQVTEGLHAIVMRNSPFFFTSVNSGMLPDMSEDKIFEIAIANSSTFLPELGSEDYDGFTLYFIDSDPDLINALTFVPKFWDIVRERFGEDFVFVVPRRDQLFVFDARRDGFMDDARRMIDITFEDRFNLLSPEIYALEDGKIVAVEPL